MVNLEVAEMREMILELEGYMGIMWKPKGIDLKATVGQWSLELKPSFFPGKCDIYIGSNNEPHVNILAEGLESETAAKNEAERCLKALIAGFGFGRVEDLVSSSVTHSEKK